MFSLYKQGIKPVLLKFTLLALISSQSPDLYAEQSLPNSTKTTRDKAAQLDEGWLTALQQVDWEFASVLGGITYLGVAEWDWGSASFSFNDEGWFQMDTGSGGADKLGHLYSAYLMDEFLTHGLYKDTGDWEYSAKYGAIFSWGLMFFVEMFDGFSGDHGFSYEDLIMNTTGIGISYLKNVVPGLRDKLDLRIEYHPSKAQKGFHPVTDYTGLRYLSVLRLSGFDSLRESPLKYLELHLGYRARGFKKQDAPYFSTRETEVYAGVGVNLSELVFKPAKASFDLKALDYADTFTRYYQVPGTYVAADIHSRSGPRRN